MTKRARASSGVFGQKGAITAKSGTRKKGGKSGLAVGPARKRSNASDRLSLASEAAEDAQDVASGRPSPCPSCGVRPKAGNLSACDDCRLQQCEGCLICRGPGVKMCKQCSPTTLGGKREPCRGKCRHCGQMDGWVCDNCDDRVCQQCHSTPCCENCQSTFLCSFCDVKPFLHDDTFCRVCAVDGTVCRRCCEDHACDDALPCVVPRGSIRYYP